MPGKPAANLQNDIQTTEEIEQQMPSESPEQVVIRELTQTDRLNKRLLTSFLQRMNNSSGEFSASNAENQEKINGSSTSTENEF